MSVLAWTLCLLSYYTLTVFGNPRRKTDDNDNKGSGEIVIDDLECLGTETDVSECRSSEWQVHNCGHQEDVVIKCGNLDDILVINYSRTPF